MIISFPEHYRRNDTPRKWYMRQHKMDSRPLSELTRAELDEWESVKCLFLGAEERAAQIRTAVLRGFGWGEL